jgi:CheY-like chemotaxis protein
MTAARPQIAVAIGDPDIRDMLCELLTEEGYRVHLIARPTRAATLAALCADLIMLDCRLVPPVRGWRLLSALRAQPASQYTPIIALTADVAQAAGHQAQFEAWGVHLCLQPFEIEVLLQMVRDALSA